MKQSLFYLIICFVIGNSLKVSAQEYDLLIVNARIMDGTGNPWFRGDVGVKDGMIIKVGSIQNGTAKKRIDAAGRILCPGFIDIHSHADDTYGSRNIRADNPLLKAAHNMVMQGVTTLVVNHDGRSPVSIVDQKTAMEAGGVGPNIGLMVGHNSIRRRAMGDDYQRLATEAEVRRMQDLIREGMDDGALGLSAGLEYVPGRWSNTEEVIALVSSIKPYGGVYMVHERYSGSDPMWYLPSQHGQSPGSTIDNMQEVIRVAEETGVPSCATHVKVKGADIWGASTALVNLVNRARARGVEVWADQYPYTTSGTDGRTVLLPAWAIRADRSLNYIKNLQNTLKVSANMVKLEQDVLREIERRGGPENILVFDYPDSSFIGKTIADLSKDLGLGLVDLAIELQMNGYSNQAGGGRMRGFSMSEQDIEILAKEPWVITASDAGLGLAFSPVHARFYGTFPRKIAYYAKERGAITVEHAIRSATSLPAQFMGFKDRGLLREGYAADLTLFDLDQIKDKATFFEPHQYPEGIDYVIVNGQILVEDGKLKENIFPGKVLSNKNSRRYPGN